MSDESIELPITKPKRVYTKRTKIVIDVPAIMAEHTTTPLVLPIPELVKESYIEPCVDTQVKTKRAYVRKSKSVEPVLELTPPALVRTETVVFDTPPTSPVDVIPPKEKKPRTEKQLAAFEKMRSARASKQNELNDLKELEKTQRQLENEQRKLDNVTEKVLAKATELKTKRVSKKKVVIDEDGYRTEPESIIREQKHKPIVFM
jgi:hypothetical protein